MGLHRPAANPRLDVPGSRYELLARIAAGGMARVYVGQLRRTHGFRRLVAIKRAHAHLVDDPSFRRALLAEAKIASLIHHANVTSVHDIEELEDELLLVMEYVEGASLSELLSTCMGSDRRLPVPVAIRIVLDAAAGLDAVHEATDDTGRPLGVVHRDLSPHNVLVGLDGVSRVADFGIAKTATSTHRTETGGLKGKIAYMAPEYIAGGPATRATDLFALGVVAWETLATRRLFAGEHDADTLQRIIEPTPAPRLSEVAPWLGDLFDDVLARALGKTPEERFCSARAFAQALERAARAAGAVGSTADVAAEVEALAGERLRTRRELVRALREKGLYTDDTSGSTGGPTVDMPPPTGTATMPKDGVGSFEAIPREVTATRIAGESPAPRGVSVSNSHIRGAPSTAARPPGTHSEEHAPAAEGRSRGAELEPVPAPAASAPRRAVHWATVGVGLLVSTAIAAVVALFAPHRPATLRRGLEAVSQTAPLTLIPSGVGPSSDAAETHSLPSGESHRVHAEPLDDRRAMAPPRRQAGPRSMTAPTTRQPGTGSGPTAAPTATPPPDPWSPQKNPYGP
jgi:eukaryotic-like serine/threonine-protein kinase